MYECAASIASYLGTGYTSSFERLVDCIYLQEQHASVDLALKSERLMPQAFGLLLSKQQTMATNNVLEPSCCDTHAPTITN